ncbi:MAG: hypothetical protein EHM42_15010 [Planctomycetaceae bacterium]|nr:MAG: hypothetical protein EHM42_15010 [Planctomycetaceae bacterium]
MIGIKINAAKTKFFDRVIITTENRATIKALSRMGAFIRTSARSSIRKAGKKGKTSKPGQPPRSQTGLLKKHIYFGYEGSNRSVVVGPARLGGTSQPESVETLEHGGNATITSGRKNPKTRVVPIEARPYMGPAMQKNLPKFPSLWANTFRP